MIVLAGSGWLSLVDGYPDGKLRVMERRYTKLDYSLYADWIGILFLIPSSSNIFFVSLPLYSPGTEMDQGCMKV